MTNESKKSRVELEVIQLEGQRCFSDFMVISGDRTTLVTAGQKSVFVYDLEHQAMCWEGKVLSDSEAFSHIAVSSDGKIIAYALKGGEEIHILMRIKGGPYSKKDGLSISFTGALQALAFSSYEALLLAYATDSGYRGDCGIFVVNVLAESQQRLLAILDRHQRTCNALMFIPGTKQLLIAGSCFPTAVLDYESPGSLTETVMHINSSVYSIATHVSASLTGKTFACVIDDPLTDGVQIQVRTRHNGRFIPDMKHAGLTNDVCSIAVLNDYFIAATSYSNPRIVIWEIERASCAAIIQLLNRSADARIEVVRSLDAASCVLVCSTPMQGYEVIGQEERGPSLIIF